MGRIVQSYFRRLDREATAKNAELVLGDYRHRHQKARRAEVAGLKSPSMDGMPRTESIENGVEDKIINHLSDQEFAAKVILAIECIEDDEQRHLLKLLYIGAPLSVEAIQTRLSLSAKTYYRVKEDALNAFAEVWPPAPSELLVYLTQKGH